jgi:magnesium-transporting ATPase (P-type)
MAYDCPPRPQRWRKFLAQFTHVFALIGQTLTIEASEVVVADDLGCLPFGDVVVLSPGDRVPADLTLIAAD